MDSEDMVSVVYQLFNCKDDNCPLIGTQNIQIKNTHKILTQHIAKHPPPKTRSELDTKRKTPACTMLSRKPLAKKVSFEHPNEDQDEEGYSTVQKDESTPTDNIINEDTEPGDEDDIIPSEDYNTNLNYLPLPSFNNMDVTQTAAYNYEDFFNY
eukprot:2464812-Ditylum_brightwellii.AAC.1